MTKEETEKYLRSALDRLAYMSGLSMGLAPRDREAEIKQAAQVQLAFIAEAEIRMNEEPPK